MLLAGSPGFQNIGVPRAISGLAACKSHQGAPMGIPGQWGPSSCVSLRKEPARALNCWVTPTHSDPLGAELRGKAWGHGACQSILGSSKCQETEVAPHHLQGEGLEILSQEIVTRWFPHAVPMCICGGHCVNLLWVCWEALVLVGWLWLGPGAHLPVQMFC